MNLKKIKLPVFWVVFISVAAFLVLSTFVGLVILNEYLRAFELSQPIHSAKSSFVRYFEGDDFEEAVKLSGLEVSEFESASSASEAIKALAEGKKLDFYSASSKDGKALYHVVLIDEKNQADGEVIPSTKLGSIQLKKKTEKGSFGCYGYEFEKVSLATKGEESVRALLPAGYQLLVNEKAAGEAYQIQKSEHEWNSYLPEGVSGIEMIEYEISGLFLKPSLSATDAEGNEVELLYDEEAGLFRAEMHYENADKALADRILTGMKNYAAYIQNDGSIGKVSPYFDTGSMFYRNTASNPSVFVWDHNGYEFKNETIEDFYFFDENTLCCHVLFDQVLKKYGSEDYVDRIDMTIFVRKIGSTWRIYDRIVR